MLSPIDLKRRIDELITYLVAQGLADDQQFAFVRQRRGGIVEVTFEGANAVAALLGTDSYETAYRRLLEERAYSVRMLDGALLQIMYSFSKGRLVQHRLAFLGAPDLEEFQSEPETYHRDEVHADVVGRKVLPLTVRFDYDEDASEDVVHPKSHLTLGEYDGCRVPASKPLVPGRFLDFVLRNFYETSGSHLCEQIPRQTGAFPDSISPAERSVVHLEVPA